MKQEQEVKRLITMLVIHCTATRCNRRYSLLQLYHDHVEVNHWRFIGYHFYILRDGKVEVTRPLARMGAHAKGYNAHSIGICYEGGLDEMGHPTDTRTPEQKEAMARLIVQLKQQFPTIHTVLGHCDLPGVQKACPCFDATLLQPLLQVRNLDEWEAMDSEKKSSILGTCSGKKGGSHRSITLQTDSDKGVEKKGGKS